MKAKVLICGGHVTPALAIIEKFQEQNRYDLIYVGRKFSMEGDDSISLEYKIITKLKIPFIIIKGGRLQRTFTIYTIPSLLRFPISVLQALNILLRERPKIIISFGGYLALAVCLAGAVLGIPIVTHEQTHAVGLANKIIFLFARKVFLSFEQDKYTDKTKYMVTGNPIRKSLFSRNFNSKLVNFGNRRLPLIYITGGSLGSMSINKIVKKILPRLIGKYRILHQTGEARNKSDFYSLSEYRKTFPKNLSNYNIVSRIDPEEIGEVYRNTRILIGRSGANTVTEIAAFKIPAILFPLPWSGGNEQQLNADLLKNNGVAFVFNQDITETEKLVQKINFLNFHYPKIRQKFLIMQKYVKIEASDNIYAEIIKLLENSN